jgi:hypothetical protein
MAFVTLLEKQKEFFESYKSKFLEILKDEIRKVDGKEVNIQKFLNYTNLLYDAFLNQDSPTLLEKLKKVLYEAFKNGIPVRKILENTFIRLLKDYIDYQQSKDSIDLEQIKLLVNSIENYLKISQEVFLKYMEDLAKQKQKQEEIIKPNEEILEKLRKLNPVTVNLITFFDGFPVVCRTTVERISSFIEVSSCNYKAFAPNTVVYLQIPRTKECVKGVIINIHKHNFVVNPIKLGSCPKTSPVKVFPKKEIDVKICKETTCVYGFLKNISLEEIEILTKNAEDIKEGDKVEILFSLPNAQVKAEAVVKNVERIHDNYNITAKFISNRKLDKILSEYIIKRQQEILKELRI